MSWDVAHDPAIWLEVPDLDDERDVEEWLDRATHALVADFSVGLRLRPEYPEILRHQLSVLVELAHAKAPTYGHLFAHAPGPDWPPFPVFVAFHEPQAENPDYLLWMAGATGLPSVQPPLVEHLVTDDLGEGVRVLRYEQSDELGLVANLCYAWRAHDTDVFVFVQTDDLARLEEIGPDLTDLIASIRPVAEADRA